MAVFCRRNSLRSSDMENLMCTLSSAEEVETPAVVKEHRRPGEGEAIHPKVSGHQTALHRSAMVGNSEAMAALVAGGCAVDLQDPLGNTALHEASWHGFTPCAKLLVRAGADVRVRNKAGNTALHLACQNAHAATAQLLLLAGSNLDAKNKVGDTCLHVAARYNNQNLLKMLLGSRCCLNETNQVGDTALHVAAALNHRKAVQLLLSAGLDVRVRNKAGQTALDKAREHQSKQVLLLLSKVPQVRYMRRKTTRRPRPRSPTRPAGDSSCRTEQTEPRSDVKDLDEEGLLSGRKPDKEQKDESWDEGGKPFQLYTLYRDREGRVRQAPAGSCLCESLLKKLQENLKTTEEELKLQILNVKEELHRQMERMERRNKHQLGIMHTLIQEKAAVESRSIASRMEQRAAQERAEALRNQAALRRELKAWCLSLLEEANVPVPAETQHRKLLLSPSAAETNLESVPLLLSEDSSPSFPTYTLRPRCSESMDSVEQTASRTYFEMKVARCAGVEATDQDQNPESSLCLPAVSAAPSWRPASLQDRPESACCHQEPSDSSSSTGPPEEVRGPTDDTMVLEFLMDRPGDPSLIQERKHLHAMEVTRRFFDAVSAQLERLVLREDPGGGAAVGAPGPEERTEMLQRIRELEDELHKLHADEGAESFVR